MLQFVLAGARTRSSSRTEEQAAWASTYRYSFPPYPLGWFQVAYTDELEVGDVRALKYFGKDLVLFRDESGNAHVLDAHCPHLGAHLGKGGRVEGDSIRCPFHAWKFNGSGECTDVPYGSKIPSGACVPAWNTIEKNGLIMVWHHPKGEPPAWGIPDVPEYNHEDWTRTRSAAGACAAETRRWRRTPSIRAHFLYLHGTHNMPEAKIRPEGHILYSTLPTTMNAGGNLVEGEVQVQATASASRSTGSSVSSRRCSSTR